RRPVRRGRGPDGGPRAADRPTAEAGGGRPNLRGDEATGTGDGRGRGADVAEGPAELRAATEVARPAAARPAHGVAGRDQPRAQGRQPAARADPGRATDREAGKTEGRGEEIKPDSPQRTQRSQSKPKPEKQR